VFSFFSHIFGLILFYARQVFGILVLLCTLTPSFTGFVSYAFSRFFHPPPPLHCPLHSTSLRPPSSVSFNCQSSTHIFTRQHFISYTGLFEFATLFWQSNYLNTPLTIKSVFHQHLHPVMLKWYVVVRLEWYVIVKRK
jgi:hypothetical protein